MRRCKYCLHMQSVSCQQCLINRKNNMFHSFIYDFFIFKRKAGLSLAQNNFEPAFHLNKIFWFYSFSHKQWSDFTLSYKQNGLALLFPYNQYLVIPFKDLSSPFYVQVRICFLQALVMFLLHQMTDNSVQSFSLVSSSANHRQKFSSLTFITCQ